MSLVDFFFYFFAESLEEKKISDQLHDIGLGWISYPPTLFLGHYHFLKNYQWVHLCSTFLPMLEDVSENGFQIIWKSSIFSVFSSAHPK